MQLITQESIRSIVREREQVESGVQRAEQAEQMLAQIADLGKDTRLLEQIAESSNQQLQLARDVVLAVEQISSLAKSNRGSAESVGWTLKSLTNVSPQLRKLLTRLTTNGQAPHNEVPREDAGNKTTSNLAAVTVATAAPAAEVAPLAPIG
jgi:methyl-accepting chemotaxis protein